MHKFTVLNFTLESETFRQNSPTTNVGDKVR